MKSYIIVALLSLIVFITSLVSMNKIKTLQDMPGSPKKELQNQNMIIM